MIIDVMGETWLWLHQQASWKHQASISWVIWKNWSHSLVVKIFECSSNIALISFLSNDQSENHLANHIWPQGFYSNQILNCEISNSGGNIFCETHLATHIWEVGPTVAPGIARFHFWWQGVKTTPMTTVTKDDNIFFRPVSKRILGL